jgi:hypothetical protein
LLLTIRDNKRATVMPQRSKMKMSQRGNVFSLSDILLGCSSASGQSRTANLVAKVMGTVHIIKFFQKIICFRELYILIILFLPHI